MTVCETIKATQSVLGSQERICGADWYTCGQSRCSVLLVVPIDLHCICWLGVLRKVASVDHTFKCPSCPCLSARGRESRHAMRYVPDPLLRPKSMYTVVLIASMLCCCRASDVVWHENNWDNDDSRFLAFTLLDTSNTGAGDIYAAFNAHTYAVAATLPSPPHGQKWTRVVDTNLPSPKDITPGGNSGVEPVYSVQSFSSIMLLARPNA